MFGCFRFIYPVVFLSYTARSLSHPFIFHCSVLIPPLQRWGMCANQCWAYGSLCGCMHRQPVHGWCVGLIFHARTCEWKCVGESVDRSHENVWVSQWIVRMNIALIVSLIRLFGGGCWQPWALVGAWLWLLFRGVARNYENIPLSWIVATNNELLTILFAVCCNGRVRCCRVVCQQMLSGLPNRIAPCSCIHFVLGTFWVPGFAFDEHVGLGGN